jgi:UDP-N-acetylglucosamine 1-carboxyvinyltransferase
MSQLRIIGGRPLAGSVRVSGSKNAALPMMTASILAEGPLRLENVPQLTDVQTLIDLLAALGVDAAHAPGDTLRLKTVDATPVKADYELVRRMRAGFCVLGPLLARRGNAVVSLPGGCAIGDRPVDRHLAGLAALGAELSIEHGYVVARARRLVGTTIHLAGPNGPTVTGTANVLSAAVLARGETILTGAATEPEIVDFGQLLVAMGAKIDGLGTSTLRILGVDRLSGATHRVIPDRIEAATLLLAAAVTRGRVNVTGIVPEHLTEVLHMLAAAGCRLTIGSDFVEIAMEVAARPIDIVAQPYPGVPTDIQAQWMALLSLATGRSTIRDRVFPGRFMHVAELNRLGARIEHADGTAIVTGVARLTGATVSATDLRASAALVLAGLAAEGETSVRHLEHLDRGYQRLDEKLNHLGANTTRSEDNA